LARAPSRRMVKSFDKCSVHDGTLERCVPLVPQRNTPLSRALNLAKNSVCILCLMIDSNIVISKLWGVRRTQSCDPLRGLEIT
jgi:hypothetical protein